MTIRNPLLLVAAAVLIGTEKRVLLAQRPASKNMAGLWEFPGGKIGKDETPESALIRELQEELGIMVAAENLYPLSFASHAYENFHLLMPVFSCRVWQGAPHPKEGQKLAWARKEELRNYPMPPADVELVWVVAELL